MNENPSASSRRGVRTFRATCVVLATVAVAQAAATAWTTQTHDAALAHAAKESESKTPKALDPFSPDYRPEDPHPELLGPAGDAPLNDPGVIMLNQMQRMVVVPRPKLPAPLDVPITDEKVLQHLDEALYLRGRGDMQGALEQLRAALSRLPDHPKLLYHTAQTYDTMGLANKAVPHWKSLHKLGSGAGDFYVLAQERIANGAQAAHEPEEEKEGKFTILDLKDEESPDVTGGQRVRIVAVLKKNTAEPVDLEKDMVLATHFFDTVNGRRVARSQVNQPAVECLSLPLDWTEGTETFAFDYWQPDMTPQEIVRYGRCKYYGCALEVFFKEKLQDSTATDSAAATSFLLQMARDLPVPAPEPEPSILDSAPAPGGAAEAGLFPPQLKP
jgi:hypothetical protein